MKISWGDVGTDIDKAVGKVLGGAWNTIGPEASKQLISIVDAGRRIENNKAQMQQAEYENLKRMEQRAVVGILQTYEGISLDVAQQAVAAAWKVMTAALKTAYPALGIVL